MDIYIKILDYLPEIIQAAFFGLVAWGYWSVKRMFVTWDDCKKCREDVDGRLEQLVKDHRVSESDRRRLESSLANLPTSQDLQNLALGMKEIEGNIKGLDMKVDGQGRSLARMEKNVDMLTSVHLGNSK